MDPEWGDTLQRIYLGKTTQEDVEKINTRVLGLNLSLPSLVLNVTEPECSNANFTFQDRRILLQHSRQQQKQCVKNLFQDLLANC
jgi:hypothetical protein